MLTKSLPDLAPKGRARARFCGTLLLAFLAALTAEAAPVAVDLGHVLWSRGYRVTAWQTGANGGVATGVFDPDAPYNGTNGVLFEARYGRGSWTRWSSLQGEDLVIDIFPELYQVLGLPADYRLSEADRTDLRMLRGAYPAMLELYRRTTGKEPGRGEPAPPAPPAPAVCPPAPRCPECPEPVACPSCPVCQPPAPPTLSARCLETVNSMVNWRGVIGPGKTTRLRQLQACLERIGLYRPALESTGRTGTILVQ